MQRSPLIAALRDRFGPRDVELPDDAHAEVLAAGGSWSNRPLPWIIGLAVVAAIGWWFLRPPAAPVEVALPAAGEASPPSASPTVVGGDPTGAAVGAGPADGVDPGATSTSVADVPIVVHASGAVASPGVYRLPLGSRVDDLIRAAGGLVAEGDGDRVNLAAPLVDGERIWVPRRGEAEAPDVVAGGAGGGTSAGSSPGSAGSGSAAAGGGGSSSPTELVNLNTATAEELDTLPGVGPATAAAILAHREQNGAFRSVDDLLEVRGIGEAKLEQLRPLVQT